MPIKKLKSESRDKLRITRVLPIDITIVDMLDSTHHLSEGSSFGGRTINISRTGLLVNSDYELDPKTVVDVQLEIDKPVKKKITMRAEVAWAKRNAIALYGRWGMGLHIIKAKPADLEALHTFFDSISQ